MEINVYKMVKKDRWLIKHEIIALRGKLQGWDRRRWEEESEVDTGIKFADLWKQEDTEKVLTSLTH
jgi:hypothetical protein